LFLADGALAGCGVEVFPRADRVRENGGVGNQIWLPWFHGAKPGGNVFYRRATAGLEPFVPESFEAVTEGQIDHALARLEGGAS
jgi:hypothetical protein